MAILRVVERVDGPADPVAGRLRILTALQRKVLWLSAWMIHNANHLRLSRDGLKVGGHQASSASLVTLMTALYFDVLRPQDRVAVKPHASPVFHAIQYLLGNQALDKLQRFRALGGAQSYPSRTKDSDDVDYSTGSVGLGVGITLFGALVQDYIRLKGLAPDQAPGRVVALVGDAELDEGNVFEALLEGWKHDVRNLWWVIDYNRQSLDTIVSDRLFNRIDTLFGMMGWRVVTLKYGKRLQAAFARPDGEHLREWIDACPNSLYSALVYKGGAGWREALTRDLNQYPGIRRILEQHDDAALHRLMTNLAGNDMQAVLDAFEGVSDDQPTCFIAYTIKGQGLPFAGHKDNHSGLMTLDQMASFKKGMTIEDGQEWDKFAGLSAKPDELQAFIAAAPFNTAGRRRTDAPVVAIPAALPRPTDKKSSTQEGFGKILNAIAGEDSELARRIVTTSPDVTVSTNLGPWVNRRGLWAHTEAEDVFRELKVVSAQLWRKTPRGQHLELGIAENNLFIQLAAMGLSHQLFGARLLPIGTLYDPFIARGLDALNYACYQEARFIVVGTPSGITLGPEGGAHQSIAQPLIGMAQDGLAAFEPAFVDELAAILKFAFDYIQKDSDGVASERNWLRDETGGSVYLRLSTRPVEQIKRTMTPELRQAIVDGAYWLREPGPNCQVVVAYTGAIAPEAIQAVGLMAEDRRDVGLLAITSADRLNAGWTAAQRARERGLAQARSHIERLVAEIPSHCGIVSVLDGHPATLAWLGAVHGHRVRPLGVEHFGQTGSIPDLYRHYGIDANAVVAAAATLTPGRPMRHLKALP